MYAQQDILVRRDLSFNAYNQTQVNSIAQAQVNIAAAKIMPAGKFQYTGPNWVPVASPGYKVISMLNGNEGNEDLVPLLTGLQKELKYNLQPLNAFYMLPADSFHQTIATALSGDRFAQYIADGMESVYTGAVNKAFSQVSTRKQSLPIRMRLIGLGIFKTAIAMVGTFDHESDYNHILRFRDGFYGDEGLAELGINRTNPFTGRINLAYAEQKLNKNQKEHLAITINEINESIRTQRIFFQITNAGLYRYKNLAAFHPESNLQAHSFNL